MDDVFIQTLLTGTENLFVLYKKIPAGNELFPK